jgi:hypothetical protein
VAARDNLARAGVHLPEAPVISQLRLIVLGVIVLVAAGGLLYWNHHERTVGAVACKQSDLDAAKSQLEKQALQLAAYQEQLGDANEKLEDARRLLALAAAAPVPRLVCHTAGPKPVQQVPGKAGSGTPATGVPDWVRGPDFDPGPALRSLSVGYEGRVEQARDALNRWPK